MIDIRGVVKTYGSGDASVAALRGVNLSVHRGSLVMLVGPSGSGKTTLLSVMGCILRATNGSVRVNGVETAGLSESDLPPVRLRHFGFVFQSFNLFPTLTARENVELALHLRNVGRSEARRRATAILEELGLAEKLHRFPAELSGGEKQRTALARAVVSEPEVVLADEPTAALDSHAGKQVIQILSTLAHQKAKAVVVVTHDNRLMDYADRIVRIEDGVIQGGA
jgi:putative ABC transport system ATP-binding protein